MNVIDYVFMVGDFTVAIALAIGFIAAYHKGHISKTYQLVFWIGCLIGSTWEFTFLYLGNCFLSQLTDFPSNSGVTSIHAILTV